MSDSPGYALHSRAGDLLALRDHVRERLDRREIDYHEAYGMLAGAIAGHVRVTYVGVTCMRCSRIYDTRLWFGSDAHVGTTYTESHGVCDACEAGEE